MPRGGWGSWCWGGGRGGWGGAVNLPHGTKRGAGSVVKLTLELAALTAEMVGRGPQARTVWLPQVGTLDFCSSRSGGSLCWVCAAGVGGDRGLDGGWGGGGEQPGIS